MTSPYYDYWLSNDKPSYTSIAAHFGVNESTVRKSIQRQVARIESQDRAEPGVLEGMKELGFV